MKVLREETKMKTRQEQLDTRLYFIVELEERILPWVEKYNEPYEIMDVDYKEVCYNSILSNVEDVKQEIEKQAHQIDRIEWDIKGYNEKFSREIKYLFNRELTLDETIKRMYYIKYDEGFDYIKELKSNKGVVEMLKGQIQWLIDYPEDSDRETIEEKKEKIIRYEKDIEKLNQILKCEFDRIRDILYRLINYQIRLEEALDELYTYIQDIQEEY